MVLAWCAWQIATASASAASALSMEQPGKRRRTINWIWVFSAWPAPTTDFLTRLVEYSDTLSPRSAGASSTTPRATPSFRVEAGFLLTKVSSTAASSGRKRSSTSPIWRKRLDQTLAERQVDRGVDDAVGDMGQAVAGDIDDPPAGMAQAGIETENAHRINTPLPQAGEGGARRAAMGG